MLGIDPKVMVHRLSVNHSCKPVKQKKRSFALECQHAIEQEVDKLYVARFICKVNCP